MKLPRRAPQRLLLLPCAALVTATLAGVPTAAVADPTADMAGQSVNADTSKVDESGTVTLITGDRVTLRPSTGGDPPEVIIDPGSGSMPSGFEVRRSETGVQVVPHAVMDLVPDVLDPSLFDITGLIEMGYDDASSDTLPLIVQHDPAARTHRTTSPLRYRDSLGAIDAAAVDLDKDETPDFGDDLAAVETAERADVATALNGVSKIWLDRKVSAAELDGYLTQIAAPTAWDSGLDGSGVTVAVLDTGVDADHPDLSGRIVAEANFTHDDSAKDEHGHGTHVASLAAGTGAGAGGARQGVAPGADVISGKVLDSDGRGQASWVISGMEWAVDQGADIVNLSLGAAPTETDDPLVLTLEALAEHSGTLFVVAAGNFSPNVFDPGTINTPGSAPSALTVGAVNADDSPAFFSGQGPTLGSYRLKPDVGAPGVGILGARAGARDGDLYVPMSGTSMATPIVAGAAALLMQQYPEWTWQEIKARLMTTADVPDWYMAWKQGAGRINVGEAIGQVLVADVASLDFGFVMYGDEEPRTRTVTLTNTGTEPIPVVVTDHIKSDTEVPADDDALVADPAAFTVPAGGTASTTVTFRPDLVDDGFWDGSVAFTSGGERLLHLPFGAFDEPERYDLEIQVLDRNGEPYDPATGAHHPYGDTTIPIFNADNGVGYRLRPDEFGYAKARVVPGSYSAFAGVVTPASGDEPETLAIAGTPELIVESDVSYVIDARDAERLDPPTIAGQPTSPEHAVGITYARHAGDGMGYIELGFFDPEEVTNGQLYVTPTSTVDRGTFEATFRWRLAPTGNTKATSPDAYELLLASPQFPEPLSPTVSASELRTMAEVETTFHPFGKPGEYPHGVVHQAVETGVGFVYWAPMTAPHATRVLATAQPNIRWAQCISPPVNDYIEMCDDLGNYGSRERVATQFGAALRPEVQQIWHSAHSLYVNTGIGDGQHTASLSPTPVEGSTLTLHRNGELIDSANDVAAYFAVPDEPGRFRLEQSWTLNDEFSRSRRAETVWEFDSAAPADPSQGFSASPTLMAIDYRADVDEMGRVQARKPVHLEVEVNHKGRGEPPTVDSLSLWWSVDDGATWQPATIQKSGNMSPSAVIPGRALQSGSTLSLRVAATDTADSSIEQTVMNIFPVR